MVLSRTRTRFPASGARLSRPGKCLLQGSLGLAWTAELHQLRDLLQGQPLLEAKPQEQPIPLREGFAMASTEGAEELAPGRLALGIRIGIRQLPFPIVGCWSARSTESDST